MTIPNRPWLYLREAMDLLAAAGLYEDDPIAESVFLSRAGFAGRLLMRGKPTEPYGDEPTGPEQDIPPTYFAHTRSFYGDVGIGWDAFHDTGKAPQKRPFESDWSDVFVSTDTVSKMISADAKYAAHDVRSSGRRGPSLDSLERDLRKIGSWVIEQRASGTLPQSANAATKRFLSTERDVSVGPEAIRKIFTGQYGPALRLASEGRTRSFWPIGKVGKVGKEYQ